MGAIIYLIIIVAVIALYCLYIYLLFWLSFILFPFGCAAFIGTVLYNYIHTMWAELFVSTGWTDSANGPEPAYRQYYFRKAYRDYELVVRKSWPPNRAAAEWVINAGKKLFSLGFGTWFTWPLGVTVFVLAATGAVAGGIAYVFFGLVHLLVVVTCAVFAFCFALLFRFAEYMSMLWRQIFLVCPNAGCYKKISLPLYLCPHCGVHHKKLIPGSYGVLRRRCQCGTLLPTLFLFGRNNLPSLCPHEECGQPLSTTMGVVRNLHVPLVGGPAAGKTSFLMANMSVLQQRADSGTLGLEFPEKKHKTMFEKSRQNFRNGVLLDKTASDSPDAFLVNFRDGGGHEGLLYMYDAAGELYQRTDVLRRHGYYEYTHGVLFLVDPFSLPRVQTDFASDLKAAEHMVKPCDELPQDVYSRMIGSLREHSSMGNRFSSVPMAVVVTKADAFGLANDIELEGRDLTAVNTDSNGGQRKANPESRTVRQWLLNHGEGNLIRNIENDFKDIQYFHCSALGRLPDGSAAPFKPEGVLEPLDWILGHYRLNLDGHGPAVAIPPRSSRPAPTFAPSAISNVNGMVVSGLWSAAVVLILVFTVTWLVNAQPWINGFSWNSDEESQQDITSQQPVLARPPNTETRPQSSRSNARRPVEKNVSVVAGTGSQGQFEIRVLSGFVYRDRVALRVRETSINCDCPWLPWRDVVGDSYIVDDAGNRYSADLSHSVGWTDGNVSSGGYREGTIVFWGAVPHNSSRISLAFAWIRNQPVTLNLSVE